MTSYSAIGGMTGTSGGTQFDSQGHSAASSHAGSRCSAHHSAWSQPEMHFSDGQDINEDVEVGSTMSSAGMTLMATGWPHFLTTARVVLHNSHF